MPIFAINWNASDSAENLYLSLKDLIPGLQNPVHELIKNNDHTYTSAGTVFIRISDSIRLAIKSQENIMHKLHYHQLQPEKYTGHINEHNSLIKILDSLNESFLYSNAKNYTYTMVKLLNLIKLLKIHTETLDESFVNYTIDTLECSPRD